MKGLVAAVQAVAVVAALGFAVLLFANEPSTTAAPPPAGAGDPAGAGGGGGGDGPAGSGGDAPAVDAAALFDARCSSCHGPGGAGGFAPQLSDGRAAAAFPDIEDQIAVVTEGRGGMPAFGGRLSADEIRAVVAYSRTL